jgi:hypothetical protein
MNLVEHGIQNEGSDLRAHVCFGSKVLYVYDTVDGLEAIEKCPYPPRLVYRDINGRRVCTAKGYVIPIGSIRNIRCIHVPTWVWERYDPKNGGSPSSKGRAAAEFVQWTMENGFFPIPFVLTEATYVEQLEGIDIVIKGESRVQVKCDYRGGHKGRGGTGNLFLQIAECNPLKEY